jgi:hypothetical protein
MRSYLLIIATGLLLMGCVAEYYPTMLNAPLFKGEEEFEASILTGTSGYDVQIAYAPINHLGFLVSGSYKDRRVDNDSTDFKNYHKHLFGEFGAGYFVKISDNFVFEAFAGGGYGSMEGVYHANFIFDFDDYDRVEYAKLFLQPQIGVANDVFEFAFATRLSGINVWYLDSSDSTDFGLFLEPLLSFKVGYRYVKFTTQFGLSFPLNENFDFEHNPFIFGVGLNFSFGGYRKKEE